MNACTVFYFRFIFQNIDDMAKARLSVGNSKSRSTSGGSSQGRSKSVSRDQKFLGHAKEDVNK